MKGNTIALSQAVNLELSGPSHNQTMKPEPRALIQWLLGNGLADEMNLLGRLAVAGLGARPCPVPGPDMALRDTTRPRLAAPAGSP